MKSKAIDRVIFLILAVALCTANTPAQNSEFVLEKGVSPHKKIDAIYEQFSEAYRTLNVERVVSLYAENAAYLPPDDDILQGREQIRSTFKSFFDYVKNESRTMTISFRIFQRKVGKDLAYDVGIYTIRQFKDAKEISSGQGKFVVVAVRENDGKWRFQVDGYSDLKPPKQN